MPITDDAPIIRPGGNRARGEVRVNTQVLQLGPGQFRIIAVTTEGMYVGEIALTALNQDSISILAQALSRFAQQQATQLVRADGPLPPLNFDK